jgi:hypothetical protein
MGGISISITAAFCLRCKREWSCGQGSAAGQHAFLSPPERILHGFLFGRFENGLSLEESDKLKKVQAQKNNVFAFISVSQMEPQTAWACISNRARSKQSVRL